jgi:hypothetical protein
MVAQGEVIVGYVKKHLFTLKDIFNQITFISQINYSLYSINNFFLKDYIFNPRLRLASDSGGLIYGQN